MTDLWRTHHLSRSAYDRLKAEFDDLTTRGRIEVANKIETARLMGDLSENGDYHAAKDEQGHMEGRIRQLEHLLDPLNHEIVEAGRRRLVGPGLQIVTILYEGDDDDMAERYLIGHPSRRRPTAISTIDEPAVAARPGSARSKGPATGSSTTRRTAPSR